MRFAEIFEGSVENTGKRLQGQERRSRTRLGNFSGIPRNQIMEDYLERRDEEEAKQGKEPTEYRNKEYQDKVSGEEMRETEPWSG